MRTTKRRKSNEARREKGEKPQGYLPTPEAKVKKKKEKRKTEPIFNVEEKICFDKEKKKKKKRKAEKE